MSDASQSVKAVKRRLKLLMATDHKLGQKQKRAQYLSVRMQGNEKDRFADAVKVLNKRLPVGNSRWTQSALARYIILQASEFVIKKLKTDSSGA
jgi:hypothetical protein